MEQPQEIEDEEYERTWERVAAIDVAKGSGVVCTRVPGEDRPGRRKTHVHTVQATKRAVIELADHLRGLQVQIVTLESTLVIRGADRMNRTLPRSCRRGHVRDGKDKSGNDERWRRDGRRSRLSASRTVPR